MDKLLQMLGFCHKAGKLNSGTDIVRQQIKNEKAYLVIGASDLSERLWQDIKKSCEYRKIPYIRVKTKLEIGNAIGKSPRGLIAILDKQFAIQMLNLDR